MTDVYTIQRDAYVRTESKYTYDWEDAGTGWNSSGGIDDYQSNYEVCTGCNEWKRIYELKYARKYDSYLCTDCIETYA